MNCEIVLHGCSPTPLASYLKALAVLRLVAEQAEDPDATGFWCNDAFVLRTRLREEDLVAFFLDRYQPTPIVAPWNGGSGFFQADNQSGINPLECSQANRFSEYRAAIACARNVLAKFGLTESPKDEEKAEFLALLRRQAPDALLRWLDAAVILADAGPSYPPLLGTGGNDGRLDFTNNFMQRLGDVLDIVTGAPHQNAADLLRSALFRLPSAALAKNSIGQFAPGNAGGPNASAGFEGEAYINPWDFILMLEGAVLFAASAVRRLDAASASVLSAPFTVRSRLGTTGASASNDDQDARGEIWMPLWASPIRLEELVTLFAEGRAALGARPVRDGLDFARAVAQLGVDRGIHAFQRYAFVKRMGKAFLAIPLTRVSVCRNPQADLIDELEQNDWLARVQRYARDKKTPSAFRAAAARLDAALFALTQRPGRAVVQDVLRRLGQIDRLCSLNVESGKAVPPVPVLSRQWLGQADDGSPEFCIALALAGLSFSFEQDGRRRDFGARPHLTSVSLDGKSWGMNRHVACWGHGALERNLFAVLHRRRLEAVRHNSEGEFLHSRVGTTLANVQRFLRRDTDDRRIAELLSGLVCIDLQQGPKDKQPYHWVSPLPAYALLKPFFTSESLLRRLNWLPSDRTLRLPAELPARLASGDLTTALTIAWQRLRALGVKLPGRNPPAAAALDGKRLLAALMIPLTDVETSRLLRWLDLSPESEEETSEPIEHTV